MKILYLHHSGFAVCFDNLTLLFDPISAVPESVLDRPVIVLISHAHHDHYDPMIWELQAPKIAYVLSDDVPAQNGYTVFEVKPYETLKIDGAEIQTFGSTDQGVSFLVTANDKTLFFSGDLNWWDWDTKKRPHINPKAEERDYKREIARLKTALDGTLPDVAFVPTDPRLDAGELKAALYFIREIHPKLLVPMHFWGDFGVIDRLRAAVAHEGLDTKIGVFSHKNEWVSV